MSPRTALLVALSLAIPAATAAGCSVRADIAGGDTVPTVTNPYGLDASVDGDGNGGFADVAASPTYQGSPLCNASRSTGCYPDDPATSTAKECKLAPDGGPYSATGGYDGVALACHVVPAAGAANGLGVQSVCTPAGSGTAGSACKLSTDCAPALECVGTGTCTHYCCAGNTECGLKEFCDIQPMAESSMTKVPVCMPIQPLAGCELLPGAQGSPCTSTTETCAVVREDGATGCVAVGAVKAGDDCDTDHCGAGLVCLGTPGQRRCFQLCHTATSAECSATQKQTCKGGLPLFPDPTVGICQ
ncbi:MAG TPA: hypothetical protein VIF15_21625 [Polyangiaceae bacterium]|jgi:hypothetical protein